jgi:hypothetical protein
LPDGSDFQLREKPFTFSKTYYVDGKAASGDDHGPGTKDRPFRSIGSTAQVQEPAGRVVIAEELCREWVNPARGGSAPEKIIS